MMGRGRWQLKSWSLEGRSVVLPIKSCSVVNSIKNCPVVQPIEGDSVVGSVSRRWRVAELEIIFHSGESRPVVVRGGLRALWSGGENDFGSHSLSSPSSSDVLHALDCNHHKHNRSVDGKTLKYCQNDFTSNALPERLPFLWICFEQRQVQVADADSRCDRYQQKLLLVDQRLSEALATHVFGEQVIRSLLKIVIVVSLVMSHVRVAFELGDALLKRATFFGQHLECLGHLVILANVVAQ